MEQQAHQATETRNGNDSADKQSFLQSAPSITLPKGGGAIRGVGEKFAANPVTGTSSMSVPIATSPGRSGFGPQLSLSYDSGAGNSPFGLGWSLSLPAITRKTDKGLPQYLDAEESDIFLLSGTEDLVPLLEQDGTRFEDKTTVSDYIIHRYRPRIEGLFARIERWMRKSDGDIHWRSISKDNILTIYGKDVNSRIADPENLQRVFSWLICETRDDKGNAVLYTYKKEDGVGINRSHANERNRGDSNNIKRTTNRYLKRIHYGNRTSMLDAEGNRPRFLTTAQINNADWMFEVVFDYEDHDGDKPQPKDDEILNNGVFKYPWKFRPDPFSTYRSGFEVRTTRLCQRVLMFHHFPQEAGVGNNCLVRSTDFIYAYEENPLEEKTPIYSQLVKVTQTGYKRDGATYLKRNLPPVEFTYTKPEVQDTVEEVDATSLENLPIGVDGTFYQWTDLHGEGIPGILTEQAGAWFYKRNLSPCNTENKVEFSPLERVASKPNTALSAGAQLMDLAGDGQPDVVVMEDPTPGLYEHDSDEGWLPFQSFKSRLNRNIRDPNLKFIDLDGDGHADVLITEDNAFVWHASLAEKGFGPARRVAQVLDEEKGPRIVFADGTQSIYLADLSGDGLTDIVRIRHGEVCYWPNLGYAKFGAKVTMDNSPWFDNPDQFDQKRIRLADIDGSGTTDIIYLHRDGVRLYFNQSGNSWSKPHQLKVFPRVDDVVSIVPTDLLGNGTACLVWSSPLPGDARRPMRYVNLMGKEKPHLLISTKNNLGAETCVHYAPSTKFYLKDKQVGKPWITRLPFPVHVVERVETWDHISKNRFVTRYAYHHGYFDGEEREFRGFGMVEQWDTEEIGAQGALIDDADNTNWDAASSVPPVHTKTWFHTGVYLGHDHVSDYFAGLLNVTDQGEYFREPGLNDAEARALLLPDTVLPDGLTPEEGREACRALKGSMLRQEVYAEDNTDKAKHPYTVTEQNFTIKCLQTRGSNKHAVFLTHANEALSYHYERNPADPRIQHALTLEVDEFGNVLKQAAIGYGRRAQIRIVDAEEKVQLIPSPVRPGFDPSDQAKQTTLLLTYTENRVTNAIDLTGMYRNPLPCEAITFELTGYTPTGAAGRFQASDLVEPDPVSPDRLRHKFAAPELAYEAIATGNQRRRPIEWLRTLYRRDSLNGLLPLGELHSLGLPGENYKLAFTPGLLAQVFQRFRVNQPAEPLLPDPSAILGGQAGNRGGYVNLDGNGNWWIPSGRSFFSTNPLDNPIVELAQARQHFFLPRRYRDPFGQDTFVDFDTHDLLMTETRDALGNRMIVDANDYRVLQPRFISDPNRNRTEVAFDTFGMVAGTAVMGKPEENLGDSLNGFIADVTTAQFDQFMNTPRELDLVANECKATQIVHDLLNGATTRIVYDLERFIRLGEPPVAATIARETHVSDLQPDQKSKLQISFSYSDGFGREIQKKIQAEKGKVPLRDEQGKIIVDPDNQPVMSANEQLRWVGSGWTVFNNKGKPVRQYEPFFSDTHKPDLDAKIGVSPVLFYDPAERVVAKLHPNNTYEKVVFDPWQQTNYDVNDTCAARNTQTGDPRTDPDIGGYVEEYFKTQPAAWQTWHAQRISGALGPDERNAALKAAAHADTPSTAHFDTLGRPFLTVVRNRVVCPGHDLDGSEDSFATRVELDIEGNQRAVRDALQQAGDALGRIVMRYAYDMLGNRIHQLSMEAGARWMLNDVAGKPIRAWDSRDHNFATTYDALRRPVMQTVRGTGAESDPRTLNRDLVVDRIEYGESIANADAFNLRTRIYRHFDSAGVATNAWLDVNGNPVEAYDFKGNLLHSTRRLISDYKTIPDWTQPPEPQLDQELFEGSTRYDALNRPIQSIAPHSNLARAKRNVIQPVFNEANLLERVDVWLERTAEPLNLLDRDTEAPSPVGVANIDYDAKGQRLRIDYKNGASTRYDYDPLTFRLTQLLTQRNAASFPGDDPQPPITGWPGKQVQNLHYTYDPAGNITHIQDYAQQTVYFRNQRIEPSNDYVYDALYRLIQATGREHLGQLASGGRKPLTSPDGFNTFHTRLDQSGDGNAMGTYIERYVYDAVGNCLQMQHRGTDPVHLGWTRAYDYLEASLIEDGSSGALFKTSNRLTRTALNPNGTNPPQIEAYQHDSHGNMLRMPHLGGGGNTPNIHWDYKDQLRQTDLGSGRAAYYVYDASGQRVRKVWEKAPGLIEERIYLGGFEIFRKHQGSLATAINANTATLERETLHVMDDKQRIALVETRTLDTTGNDPTPRQLIRYQSGNHLGSSSLELDEQAQIISYEEYAPYGSTTYQAVRSRTETAKRYRYTGKERDEESGLYYHGARYYAAWLGRWVSTDPIGPVRSSCLYCYVSQNPIKLLDPNGADEQPSWLTSLKQQAAVEGVIALRQIKAQLPLFGFLGQQALNQDALAARQLLANGNYDQALEVATGYRDYFELRREVEATGGSGADQSAVLMGHATGFNQAVETVQGETGAGEKLEGFSRFMRGVDALHRLISTTMTVASGVQFATSQARMGLPFSQQRAMNVELAKLEKLMPMVDVLTKEHPNLSAKNALTVLEDLMPPNTVSRVAGKHGGGGADVEFISNNGMVQSRVEIKAGIENANRFSEHISWAAQSQAPGGQILVQVPEGTDVSKWLGRFWGRRKELINSTASGDIEKMNFYKSTNVAIVDPKGNVLLPSQPIYSPRGK